ncbi:MAG: hypothetical protein A2Y40_09290 [Candidatus Margulisbacteria bacterium GWF2_35_9]|nr:MAG: hypothetical protein A2Y40_09290 [Candidatus Margulisbacteria bacterium GWF2_35_9]
MTRILLLGGSGFIGSNLMESLAKNNIHIINYDKVQPKITDKTVLKHITTIIGDFHDLENIESIFSTYKIDIVIHLVSTIIPGTPFELLTQDISINLDPTVKLIDIMNKHNVNKIVFFSSGGTVYGRNNVQFNNESSPTKPINFYGWLKLSIEHYIQMCHEYYGLNYLIIRPSNPYGKYQNTHGDQGLIAVTIGKALRKEPIEIWGNGQNIRDYIAIDDLVIAVGKLINKDDWDHIYNIGSGIGTSVNAIMQHIQNSFGNKLQIKYLQERRVDILENVLDCSKLNKAIHWEPKIDIKTGIQQFVLFLESK